MSCWEILLSEQRDQHSFNSDLQILCTHVQWVQFLVLLPNCQGQILKSGGTKRKVLKIPSHFFLPYIQSTYKVSLHIFPTFFFILNSFSFNFSLFFLISYRIAHLVLRNPVFLHIFWILLRDKYLQQFNSDCTNSRFSIILNGEKKSKLNRKKGNSFNSHLKHFLLDGKDEAAWVQLFCWDSKHKFQIYTNHNNEEEMPIVRTYFPSE